MTRSFCVFVSIVDSFLTAEAAVRRDSVTLGVLRCSRGRCSWIVKLVQLFLPLRSVSSFTAGLSLTWERWDFNTLGWFLSSWNWSLCFDSLMHFPVCQNCLFFLELFVLFSEQVLMKTMTMMMYFRLVCFFVFVQIKKFFKYQRESCSVNPPPKFGLTLTLFLDYLISAFGAF